MRRVIQVPSHFAMAQSVFYQLVSWFHYLPTDETKSQYQLHLVSLVKVGHSQNVLEKSFSTNARHSVNDNECKKSR